MIRSISTLAFSFCSLFSFAQPQLKIDSITVAGRYAHYEHKPGDVFTVTVGDWTSSNEKKYSAPIDPSGKFSLRLPFPVAGNIFIDWGRIYEVNAAFPGETIHIFADLDEYKKDKKPLNTRFEGANANVHTDIMRYKRNVAKYSGEAFYDLRQRSAIPPQFRDSLFILLKQELGTLRDYTRKNNTDKRSSQFLEAELYYEAAVALSQFLRIFRGDKEELFAGGYFKTLDSLKAIAQTDGFFNREYAYIVRDIQSHTYAIASKNKTKNIDSISNVLLKEPFDRELVYTWNLQHDLAASKTLESGQRQAFEARVKNPFLRSEIFAKNDELLKLAQDDALLENTRLVTTIPELATAEDLMAHIASQYKGKVIYMDIWGTWCPPCRDQMQYSPALKQRLKGKDVVFVYLANNSPETAWKTAIKQYRITGENVVHYNLPKAQQSMIEKKYIYRGFPTYILIDKEGKYITNQAPRPSDPDAVEKAISGLL